MKYSKMKREKKYKKVIEKKKRELKKCTACYYLY